MRVLSFGDTHTPFMLQKWFDWVLDIAEWYQPEKVVIVGDLTDNHALSRWPKNPEADNVPVEVDKARSQIKQITKAFPEVELILGNHDDRLKKRLYDIGLPERFGPSYRELYDLPDGWNIHPQGYECDGVYYYHGNKKGGQMPALAMAREIGQSVVCGHHHGVGGKNERRPIGRTLFGMDLGCGVDIESYGMYYNVNTQMQPVLGCGTVTDGVKAKHYTIGE